MARALEWIAQAARKTPTPLSRLLIDEYLAQKREAGCHLLQAR